MSSAEWTFMIHLSGDSNLSPEMVRAITEIGNAPVPPRVTTTIQYEPLSSWYPTLRYVLPLQCRALNRGAEMIPLPDALVEEIPKGRSQAASADNIRDFIHWSVTNYPSSHRMLILSTHSSGAVGLNPAGDSGHPQRGFLALSELRIALHHVQEKLANGKDSSTPQILDVLGLDSCLMSMLEVCYEARRFADFLVGSEGFVPKLGWPYAKILGGVARARQTSEELTGAQLCECIVDEFLRFYAEYLPAGLSVDIAVCELNKIELVQGALAKLTSTLLAQLGREDIRDAIILAHWRSQSFKFEEYSDLWDFCDLLGRECTKRSEQPVFGDIFHECQQVKCAVESVVGVKDADGGRQGFIGAEFQHSHGLSIYFPWSFKTVTETQFLQTYMQMEFPRVSGWGEFLQVYLEKTRREPRSAVLLPTATPERTIASVGPASR